MSLAQRNRPRNDSHQPSERLTSLPGKVQSHWDRGLLGTLARRAYGGARAPRRPIMSAVALIVAAGRGARFGGSLPKQYQDLGGRPVLAHALSAFAGHPDVAAVRAVIHPRDRLLYDRAADGLNLLPPVSGDDTRQGSALRGLESLESHPPEAVWIHDGARPFVTHAEIGDSLAALGSTAGVVTGAQVTDTLLRAEGDRIVTAVDRGGLWRAKTPQCFRFDDILAAHRAAADASFTDDAGVAMLAGLTVAVVEGSVDNLKVTTPADLERARRVFDATLCDIRVGSGYDVHAFAPGNSVTLCGVRIPHGRSLSGWSDADVGLHALTDAILAGLADGDIGVHFPPSDPRWRNADSAVFLAHAARRVRGRGGVLGHLGVVLVCESPQIEPVRDAMVARIASIADVDPSRVSVQATTTEGLGFTGRGDGIAAQAIATVRLPAATG